MKRKPPATVGAEPTRSAYPYYSLPEVIEFAKVVREIGGKEASEKQILKKLKIGNRVTRSWSYRLSSAREFGLLERKGRKEEAKLVVTALCVRLLTSSDERLEGARMNAFSRPPLYGKLTERYMGVSAPAVEDLAGVLVRDFGLLDSVAEHAAQAFLDSARFVGVITKDGRIDSVNRLGDSSQAPREATSARTSGAGFAPSAEGLVAHRFQLRPDVAIVVELPYDLNQSDVARLHRWLCALPFEETSEREHS